MKRRRLFDHIIDLLGKRGQSLVKDLKVEIRAFYSGSPSGDIESAVETALLEMDKQGLVQIKPGDCVALTSAGQSEYKFAVARRELKRVAKTRKANTELKKREVEEKKAKSLKVHDELKHNLCRLAVFLGYAWKEEHELDKGGPVRLDVVWYGKGLLPSHAFEVQHRSDWKNAIGNLEAARRRYSNCKAFLLVQNAKELGPIRALLGAHMNTSVRILEATQVKEWLSILERLPDSMRQRVVGTVGSILQSGLI